MRLRQLVQPFLNYQITGAENPDILHIVTDSRQAAPGALFAAIPGHTVDGHAFAAQAVEQGAVALLVERRIEGIRADVPQVIVRDTRHMSALLADRLFDRPSRRLRVVGVTGTNGKTTVTHLVRHLLEVAGRRTGVIGTVGAKYGDVELPLPNTTPEAVEVHRLLRTFVDAGCSHAVMEVSSHALVERRAAGVSFASAAFTNLTQDHLDFHGTMERYAAAKSLLFARLGNAFDESAGNSPHAVINVDDPWAQTMMDATTAPILTYGLEREADIHADDVHLTAAGATLRVRTPVGVLSAQTGLIGRFNVYNALAAIAIALVEGVQLDVIAAGLASYPGVPGRCERIDGGQPLACSSIMRTRLTVSPTYCRACGNLPRDGSSSSSAAAAIAIVRNVPAWLKRRRSLPISPFLQATTRAVKIRFPFWPICGKVCRPRSPPRCANRSTGGRRSAKPSAKQSRGYRRDRRQRSRGLSDCWPRAIALR
ncbi:hypothetical protein GCM10025858_32830 [Alicyclobacillus sacchari]|nr:hypothetical protein GCM10025858_32830 [Alicyclobacillus sacchari]